MLQKPYPVPIALTILLLMASGCSGASSNRNPTSVSQTSNASPSDSHTASRSLSSSSSASAAPVEEHSAEPNEPQRTSTDLSEFNITVSGTVWPMLIDAAGRRTGRDSVTRTIVQEIPNSSYGEDSISEATSTADAASTATTRQIQVSQPLTGQYRLELISPQGGRFRVDLFCYSNDGSAQPSASQNNNLAAGTRDTFLIKFSSLPDSACTLTQTQ